MQYGRACDGPPPGPAVKTLSDLKQCWNRMRTHFANHTIIDKYNLTVAEKYSMFLIVLGGHELDAESTPLAFEGSLFADGATPELGYLPFELQILLPAPKRRGEPCPPFLLRGLNVSFNLGERAPSVARPGFSFSINGCGREAQTISALEMRAVGYANLAVSFATLRDSHRLLSIEPSRGTAPVAADAFSFSETDLVNSTLSYFGDVTGTIGNAYGDTQNGSRATDTTFVVADPAAHIGATYRFREDGDGYRFSWLGSFPQEWNSTTRDFCHLRNSTVGFIRDVSLGSVNVSKSHFVGWANAANPIYNGGGARSTANPPSFTVYKMEATSPERPKAFGANVSDVSIKYLWDVDLLRSACARCRLEWLPAPSIPPSWTRKDPPNPSFWVALQSNAITNGFPQEMRDSLACMRPAIKVNATFALPAQQLTRQANSTVVGTHFAHVGDAACRSSKMMAMPSVMAGGGLMLPDGLGVVTSNFSGRPFGATPPSAASEWQVKVVNSTTVVGTSSELQLTVQRLYRFDRTASAFEWRVTIEDTFLPTARDTFLPTAVRTGGKDEALLGIYVNNSAVLSVASAQLVSDALIPGAFHGDARTATSTNLDRGTNGNPSSLLTLSDGRAVGLMPLDSVYRAHAFVTRGASRISASDPFLALSRNTTRPSYMARWAVYVASAVPAGTPPPPRPPGATGMSREFDLVNAIRADLGVMNITIQGGGTMGALRADILKYSNWTDPMGWDDATLRDWFAFQGLYHAGANIPRLAHDWPSTNCSRYQRNYCYGSCYAEGYESAATDGYNRLLTRAVDVVGGDRARALLYMHPFLSTEPGALDKYPLATRVLQSDGSQWCYADCKWCCMWFGQLEEAADTTGPPAVRTNAYGNELLKYVDVAMGRDGFGGIYMDESIYSESPRNFNALVWDGVSGIVDPINGSVIRTFADTTLLWAPMKLAIYERIRSRGGRAMANCAPVTEEVIADGARAGAEAVVNFVETGSAINRLRWAQLYTPIALAKGLLQPGKPSDIDPRYANVTGWPVSNLHAALDFGCVVFNYDRAVPNVTGWREPGRWVSVMAHTFPLTPQTLGAGFVVGCERVVTKTSGEFTPSSDLEYCPPREVASLCVREFDHDGWQINVRRRLAAPAAVQLGGVREAIFAVITPDSECE